jgi:hypothetical protein
MTATAYDALRELRGAISQGDGASVVSLLDEHSWSSMLQHAGDGLVLALVGNVPGSAERAAACARELRTRGWAGDDELADQLEARLGAGATPMLRPLSVDLDELSDVLEGDPREPGGRVDLRTGEVWPGEVFDAVAASGEEEDDDDPERWLEAERLGSRDGYRDMAWFAADEADPEVADRLRIALDGRGAFRRFRDVLDRWPERVAVWRAFSDDRRRGRARAWLADAGYHPAPR